MNKSNISLDLPNLQRIQLNRFAMEGSGNETRRSRGVIPYNSKNVLIMKGMVKILVIKLNNNNDDYDDYDNQ